MAKKQPKLMQTMPDGKGGWKNQVPGTSRASSVHATKAEAQARGRDMAKRRGLEHQIHRKDGTIGEKNSYGNDPYPPKG